jgi:hypothetical protein
MRKSFIIIISIVLSFAASAQYSFNGVITQNVSVPALLEVSVIPNTSYNITFGSIDQFLNGVIIPNMNTFHIKSNMPWKLSVNSTTPFFTANGVYASSNMPSTLLKIGLEGNNTPLSLSTTPQTLKNGTRGNYTALGNIFSMYLQANPSFDYGPGQYTITINYTLTAL